MPEMGFRFFLSFSLSFVFPFSSFNPTVTEKNLTGAKMQEEPMVLEMLSLVRKNCLFYFEIRKFLSICLIGFHNSKKLRLSFQGRELWIYVKTKSRNFETTRTIKQMHVSLVNEDFFYAFTRNYVWNAKSRNILEKNLFSNLETKSKLYFSIHISSLSQNFVNEPRIILDDYWKDSEKKKCRRNWKNSLIEIPIYKKEKNRSKTRMRIERKKLVKIVTRKR